MYKKILVPLDGSELAEEVLDHAEKLAETFDAEVILLQVVAFMPIYGAPELVVPFVVDEKQQENGREISRPPCRGIEEERPQGDDESQGRYAGGRRDNRFRKRKRSRFNRNVHPWSFGNYPVGLGECCAQGLNPG